jgi:hypothetical protein
MHKRHVLLAFFASVAFVACSSKHERSTSSTTGTISAPIIGGTTDTTDNWVVGIDIGGSALCSGTLIAPNLVLTARHCVSQTPEALDCTASNNIIGNYSAGSFAVSTAQYYGNPPRYSVAHVWYLNDATCTGGSVTKECVVCGYDLALLEIRAGSGGLPTAYKAPMLTKAHIGTYTAIGYGCQEVPSSPGAGCATAGYRMKLDGVSLVSIVGADLEVNGRVCGGDSGSPLYDGTNDWIMGALSRGDGPGGTGPGDPGCTVGIYTRTDSYITWLQKYGAQAAIDGGYTAPAWVTYTAPVPDAGTPQPLGSPCSGPGDCESGICVSVDGSSICSQHCSTKPCPSGFTCDVASGYCLPDAPVTDSGAPPPTDTGTPVVDTGTTTNPPPGDDAGNPDQNQALDDNQGSCAVSAIGTRGAPPPRPQPWIFAGIAASVLALARRRRR